jgi:uncharacterized repeat protein (TIGR02543 family)
MSLGHPGFSAAEEEVILKMIAKGVIVVAAAGNNGLDKGASKNEKMYPAGYDGVISVAAVNSDGKVSGFSAKNETVTIAAPGENMASISYTTNNRYIAGGAGTSFASPVVAAVAAMVKQKSRSNNAASFLSILKATSVDKGAKGYDTSYGYGVIDIDKVMTYLDKDRVKVSFDANGGTKVTETMTLVQGAKYDTLPITTRKDYSFLGWYTAKTGGALVEASTIVNETGKITLYAQWSKNYRAMFNANGGKCKIATMPISAGVAYGNLPKATRSGYAFKGWYTKKTGGALVSAQTKATATTDQTLYAQWAKQYKVTFKANKGKTSAKPRNVAKGAKYGKLPKATRSGYTFKGWYTKKKGGKKITANSKVNLKANQTLYAQWTKKKQ